MRRLSDKSTVPPKQRTLWMDSFSRLTRNGLAVASAVFLIALIIAAALANVFAPYAPNDQDYTAVLLGPSWDHIFGTDEFGRDVFSRILWGARISLTVGILGTLLGMLVGILIGIPAGYIGGAIDTIAMRVLDVMLAFPNLLLAIVVVAILGTGPLNVVIAVAVFSVPVFARISRGATITLKSADYIQASHSIGATDIRIMRSHLLPNSIPQIIVITTLRLGSSILTAASLSFLGLGVTPPSPEWGAMLSDGQIYLQMAPHVSIFPGLAILLVVMAFNILGDGLRDALDPRMKR